MKTGPLFASALGLAIACYAEQTEPTAPCINIKQTSPSPNPTSTNVWTPNRDEAPRRIIPRSTHKSRYIGLDLMDDTDALIFHTPTDQFIGEKIECLRLKAAEEKTRSLVQSSTTMATSTAIGANTTSSHETKS